jgi:hypothetical protein
MPGPQGALTVCSGCILFGTRVVIPTSLRSQVLQRLHQHHQSIVRTKAVARNYCWWPGMDADIEKVVMSCDLCSINRPDPPKVAPVEWPQPSPMQRVHMDFFGSVFNRFWLIMIDAFSKWLEVSHSPNQDAQTVINSCSQWFFHLGLPDECVSDNGPAFRSELFSFFLQKHGVKQTFTPPYHPANNGLAERAVRTVKAHLAKIQGALEEQIPWLLFTLRTTPLSGGSSPADLMFGRSLTTQFIRMNPNNILYPYHHSNNIDSYPVGLPVYYRHYSLQRVRGEKWLAGIVKSHDGTRILVLQGLDGSDVRRHLNRVRQCLSRSDPEAQSCLQDESENTFAAAALEAADAMREQLAKQQQRTPDPGPVSAASAAASNIVTPQIPQPPEEPLHRSERLQNSSSESTSKTPRQANDVAVR